jgi:TonB family protein
MILMASPARRAAAFVFVVTMAAFLAPRLTTVAVSAQTLTGPILMTSQADADGTMYRWEISPARANGLVSWDPRTTAPPLSLEDAMKAGEAWLKQQNPEIKAFELSLVSLLHLRTPDRWYYRLNFDPIVSGRRLISAGAFVAVVLFDGSVVEPRVEKSGAPRGPGGPGGGRGGGTGGEPRTGPMPSPDAGGVYTPHPGDGITPPRVIRQTKVSYTVAAMRAKIQGQVWLEAIVNTDGTVGDVKIVKSLDAVYGLDDEAVKAIKQWRFAPGTREGVPVPVRVTVEMAFSLQ